MAQAQTGDALVPHTPPGIGLAGAAFEQLFGDRFQQSQSQSQISTAATALCSTFAASLAKLRSAAVYGAFNFSGKKSSIYERFGELEGSLMQKEIWKAYVVPSSVCYVLPSHQQQLAVGPWRFHVV